MKPSLIAPCYHDLQRIALLECGGGGGGVLFCYWCLLRDSCFAQHFKWSKMKSSDRKPTLKQELKHQIQSECLSKPCGLCSFSSFDWEPDTLKTSLKAHSCMGKDLREPKSVSFTSQEQKASNLNKLCRIR